ncbi:unnamed protein product, partial [Meganyctiphanes norvegica]
PWVSKDSTISSSLRLRLVLLLSNMVEFSFTSLNSYSCVAFLVSVVSVSVALDSILFFSEFLASMTLLGSTCRLRPITSFRLQESYVTQWQSSRYSIVSRYKVA